MLISIVLELFNYVSFTYLGAPLINEGEEAVVELIFREFW